MLTCFGFPVCSAQGESRGRLDAARKLDGAGSRVLPASSNAGWLVADAAVLVFFLLLAVGLAETGATREDLERGLRNRDNPQGDLEAPCWEAPDDFDEDEQARHAKLIELAELYASHYGRPPLRTHADVLDLLLVAGVVYEVPDVVGVPRIFPKVPTPVPADVFPLDEEEAAVQRQMLIDSAYEGPSCRIIELFEPEGVRRKEIVTSLDRLARLIEGDPGDAREAIRLLTEAGDFTTTLDVTNVPSHKVFRINATGSGSTRSGSVSTV